MAISKDGHFLSIWGCMKPKIFLYSPDQQTAALHLDGPSATQFAQGGPFGQNLLDATVSFKFSPFFLMCYWLCCFKQKMWIFWYSSLAWYKQQEDNVVHTTECIYRKQQTCTGEGAGNLQLPLQHLWQFSQLWLKPDDFLREWLQNWRDSIYLWIEVKFLLWSVATNISDLSIFFIFFFGPFLKGIHSFFTQ